MRLLSLLFGFVALSASVISCKKELSSENNVAPVVIDASWEFTQDGTVYAGEIDTAYLGDQPTAELVTLEGSSSDGKPGSLVIQIIDQQIAEGAYTSPQMYFQYSENGVVIFENIPYDPGFSINITHIDSLSVSGTFSGTVKNDDGDQYTITDGKFTAAIKGLGDDDVPEPVEDYFPTATSWTYQDVNDATQTLTITSTGTAVIDGRMYYVFENDRTGEEKYYRKEGSNYYERVVFNFGLPVDPAPEIDLNILRDDANVGDYWDSDTFAVTIAGVPLDLKIRNTVTSKGTPFNINGVDYNDVIEITTEIHSKPQGSSDDFINAPDLSYTTLYAKGYGVIFYKEKVDQTFWTLSSYSKD